MNATICPTCGVRERSYDGESGSYFTYCSQCVSLYSNAPYCPRKVCTDHSTRTELVNGREAALGADPVYRCPNGHGEGTLVDWHRRLAAHQGLSDLISDSVLIPARVERQRRVLADPNAHPARRAYAEVYLFAVNEGEAPL